MISCPDVAHFFFLQGEFLELLVTVRKSPLFMGSFLPALSDVMSAGRCATLVQLDLTGNRLTGDIDEGLIQVLAQVPSLMPLCEKRRAFHAAIASNIRCATAVF